MTRIAGTTSSPTSCLSAGKSWMLSALVTLLGATMALASPSHPFARQPISITATDDQWSTAFGHEGFNSTVYAVTYLNGVLYAGGAFTTAGGVACNHVAQWTGADGWQPIGTGTDSTVYALSVYRGALVAGGSFLQAGGATANRIATWNGTAWTPFGTGANNRVLALTAFNDTLVAAGGFTQAGGVSANRIARWNGTAWSAYGTGMNNLTGALAVYNNALYAGGIFTQAGGLAANRVARWTGSAWSALGTGVNNGIQTLTSFNGSLVAGGQFTQAGGLAANYLAKWNGTAWSTCGSATALDGPVICGGIMGSQLYLGGQFQNVNGLLSQRLAIWDGTTLSSGFGSFGIGFDDTPWAIAAVNTYLVVGGDFSTPGTRLALNTGWWAGLAMGMNINPPATIATYRGQLIASAEFYSVGLLPVNSIASFDGHRWSTLGTGLNFGASCLTEYQDDLIAGGFFTTAGGAPAAGIARWDGTAWSALGSGLTGGSGNIGATALTTYNGQLVAGGTFTTAGGVSANNIAQWNGTAWVPLGSGTSGPVQSLAVWNGFLVAGGFFTTAGGVTVQNIALWDGFAWTALGTGASSAVSALATYGSDLVAGGYFITMGGVTCNYVARWNGTAWNPLGAGFKSSGFDLYGPSVRALAYYQGTLVATGSFTASGSTSLSEIARWNGTAWSALGSGITSATGATYTYAAALASWDNRLYVGGLFDAAGGKQNYSLGLWTDSAITGVEPPSPLSPSVTRLSVSPALADGTVRCTFTLAQASPVTLTVFDVRGARLRTLLSRTQSAGTYNVTWNGSVENGRRVTAGVYIVRLATPGAYRTAKIVRAE